MTKLWGGRFQKQTAIEVEQFNSSIGFDQRLYKEDIQCSRTNVGGARNYFERRIESID